MCAATNAGFVRTSVAVSGGNVLEPGQQPAVAEVAHRLPHRVVEHGQAITGSRSSRRRDAGDDVIASRTAARGRPPSSPGRAGAAAPVRAAARSSAGPGGGSGASSMAADAVERRRRPRRRCRRAAWRIVGGRHGHVAPTGGSGTANVPVASVCERGGRRAGRGQPTGDAVEGRPRRRASPSATWASAAMRGRVARKASSRVPGSVTGSAVDDRRPGRRWRRPVAHGCRRSPPRTPIVVDDLGDDRVGRPRPCRRAGSRPGGDGLVDSLGDRRSRPAVETAERRCADDGLGPECTGGTARAGRTGRPGADRAQPGATRPGGAEPAAAVPGSRPAAGPAAAGGAAEVVAAVDTGGDGAGGHGAECRMSASPRRRRCAACWPSRSASPSGSACCIGGRACASMRVEPAGSSPAARRRSPLSTALGARWRRSPRWQAASSLRRPDRRRARRRPRAAKRCDDVGRAAVGDAGGARRTRRRVASGGGTPARRSRPGSRLAATAAATRRCPRRLRRRATRSCAGEATASERRRIERRQALVHAQRAGAGELRGPQQPVGREHVAELAPRAGDEILLARLHDLRAEAGSDARPRIEVQLGDPRRRRARRRARRRGRACRRRSAARRPGRRRRPRRSVGRPVEEDGQARRGRPAAAAGSRCGSESESSGPQRAVEPDDGPGVVRRRPAPGATAARRPGRLTSSGRVPTPAAAAGP